ncbi:MAG: TIGR04283 family arsenosugar biosynthesis glycosyltransferase [Pseudomonadota bacterium]
MHAKLSIIVICRNEADRIEATLASLNDELSGQTSQTGKPEFDFEIIVVDGGSSDATIELVLRAGIKVVMCEPGRGRQLRKGAMTATGDWLLFLHADTRLEAGWAKIVAEQISGRPDHMAAFQLAFEQRSILLDLIAFGANLRTRLRSLPYGDQGVLVSAKNYEALGGYKEMPLFEDVDFVDRFTSAFGRSKLDLLSGKAITSSARYAVGPLKRVFRNATCLRMYRAGKPLDQIVRAYET